MGRDGEPVPYDALTVSPSNSNLRCLSPEKRMKKRLDKSRYEKYNKYNKSYFWEVMV